MCNNVTVQQELEAIAEDAANDPACRAYAEAYRAGEVSKMTLSYDLAEPSSSVANMVMDATDDCEADSILDAWQDGFMAGILGTHALTPIQAMVAYG